LQVTARPHVVSTDDQRYRLDDVWQPSTYSSTSVILYVQDPTDPAPTTIYSLTVATTVVGDAIGEYRRTTEPAQPSPELTTAAETAGLNLDLTLNGQTYNLVDIYRPAGTTSDGFITLFATTPEEPPEVLLARDQREANLLIFVLDTAPPAR
jgi:hypothetical protein